MFIFLLFVQLSVKPIRMIGLTWKMIVSVIWRNNYSHPTCVYFSKELVKLDVHSSKDHSLKKPPGCQTDLCLWPLNLWEVSNPTTWAVCRPAAFAWCLDRLPASQNSRNMAGQVTQEWAKQRVRFHRPSINQASWKHNHAHNTDRNPSGFKGNVPGSFHRFQTRDCCRSEAALSSAAAWQDSMVLVRPLCLLMFN